MSAEIMADVHDLPPPDDEPPPPKSEPRGTQSPAIDVASVLARWRTEGPLVHEPTGIATLDELTGGGPVYGTRWVLAGAPDAGKTALLLQLGATWLAQGLAVGALAVDEEPGDLVTRLMQRRGHSRAECERRDPRDLLRMDEDARDLEHLRLYGPGTTIEAAARDLDAYARDHNLRAALLVDSLQTVTCDAEAAAMRPMGTRDAVTARMLALRAVASRYRLITVGTSEVGRTSYRADADKPDMAAAKESGAVEYQARVLLVLRSVEGESDLLSLSVAKNKHGRSGETIGLRIDRRLMTLSETDLPEPQDEAAEREERRERRAERQAEEHDEVVFRWVLANPGHGERFLQANIRGRGKQATADSLRRLVNAGRLELRVGLRGAKIYHVSSGGES